MAYIAMRYFYSDTFSMVQTKNLLSIPMGFTNTLVLLTSSLTMALAVREAQLIPVEENEESVRHRKNMMKLLLVTALLACAFLVIKYFEYSHKIHIGLLPESDEGWEVVRQGATKRRAVCWNLDDQGKLVVQDALTCFALYFIMTGVHGLHVVIGVGVILCPISWQAWRVQRREPYGR